MEHEEMTMLIEKAFCSRKMAYAPYSHYSVGAALLTDDNEVITGCNIESASYGATVCAERTAIFKAISEGKHRFKAITIAGGMEGEEPTDYAYPCGICRQVLKEFVEDDFTVIVAKSIHDFKCYKFEELLPHGFGGTSIK